jgi:hypothetical protein
MNDELERNLGLVRRGQLAGSTLELVNEQLDVLEAKVDQRVFAALRSGAGLSPELAQQAWYEKFSYEQLRTKLNQLARSGQSAGRRIKPQME